MKFGRIAMGASCGGRGTTVEKLMELIDACLSGLHQADRHRGGHRLRQRRLGELKKARPELAADLAVTAYRRR